MDNQELYLRVEFLFADIDARLKEIRDSLERLMERQNVYIENKNIGTERTGGMEIKGGQLTAQKDIIAGDSIQK